MIILSRPKKAENRLSRTDRTESVSNHQVNQNNRDFLKGLSGFLGKASLAFKSIVRPKKLTDFEKTTVDKSYFRFEPDKYQVQAARSIFLGNNLIVSAPTGTGKTMIAEYAIRHALNDPKKPKIYYTSPLKALCENQYKHFKELFGKENVGISTGDRKINDDAPVMVMTTEIYRNKVSGLSKEGTGNLKTVIFDEAHYISDPHRGGVWEESIIKTPPKTNMVLLSATIGNTSDVSKWISEIHPTKETDLVAIPPEDRHVPLRFFLVSENTNVLKAQETKNETPSENDNSVDLKSDNQQITKLPEQKRPELDRRTNFSKQNQPVIDYILNTINAIPDKKNCSSRGWKGDIHSILKKKPDLIDTLEKNVAFIFKSPEKLKNLLAGKKIKNSKDIRELESNDPVIERVKLTEDIFRFLSKEFDVKYNEHQNVFIKALNTQDPKNLNKLIAKEKENTYDAALFFKKLFSDDKRTLTLENIKNKLISEKNEHDGIIKEKPESQGSAVFYKPEKDLGFIQKKVSTPSVSKTDSPQKKQKPKGVNHIMMDKLVEQDIDFTGLFNDAKSNNLSEVQKAEITKVSDLIEKKKPEFKEETNRLQEKRQSINYILSTINGNTKNLRSNESWKNVIGQKLQKRSDLVNSLEKYSCEIFKSPEKLKETLGNAKFENFNQLNQLKTDDPIAKGIKYTTVVLNDLSKSFNNKLYDNHKTAFINALNTKTPESFNNLIREEKAVSQKAKTLFEKMIPDDSDQTLDSIKRKFVTEQHTCDKKIKILGIITNEKPSFVSKSLISQKEDVENTQKLLRVLGSHENPEEVFNRQQKGLTGIENNIENLFKNPIEIQAFFADKPLTDFSQIAKLKKESPIASKIKSAANLITLLQQDSSKHNLKKIFINSLNSQDLRGIKGPLSRKKEKIDITTNLAQKLAEQGSHLPANKLLEEENSRIDKEIGESKQVLKNNAEYTMEHKTSKQKLDSLNKQKKSVKFIQENFDTSKSIGEITTHLKEEKDLTIKAEKTILDLFKSPEILKQTIGKTKFDDFEEIKNFHREIEVVDKIQSVAKQISETDKSLEKPFINALNSGNPQGLKAIITNKKERIESSSNLLKTLPTSDKPLDSQLETKKKNIEQNMKFANTLFALATLVNPDIQDDDKKLIRPFDGEKLENALTEHLKLSKDEAKRLPMILSAKERKNLLIRQPVPKSSRLPAHKVVEMLHKKEQETGEKFFPAISFIDSKADCNKNSSYFANPENKLSLITKEEEKEIEKRIDKFLEENPYFKKELERNKKTGKKSNNEMYLEAMKRGVGTHHRGMLAPLKTLTEELFNDKLVKCVFSTRTIAAGLDFPAKTVIINSLEQPYDNFSIISTNEFHQMAGRAGRRGKDRIGNVIVVNNVNNTRGLTFDLIKSPPDKLESNLNVNYGMVLNYLNQNTPEEARKMLLKSFKAYQLEDKKKISPKREDRNPIINEIEDSHRLLTRIWNLKRGESEKKYSERHENKIQNGLREIKKDDFCHKQITHLPVLLKTHLNKQRGILINLMGGLMEYEYMQYPRIDAEQLGEVKVKALENNKNKLIRDIKKAQILLNNASKTPELFEEERNVIKKILFNKNLNSLIEEDLDKNPLNEIVSDESYQEYQKKNCNGKIYTQDEKNIISKLSSNKILGSLIEQDLRNNFVKKKISNEMYQYYKEKHTRKAREKAELDGEKTLEKYRESRIKAESPLTVDVEHPIYFKYQKELLEKVKKKLTANSNSDAEKPEEKDLTNREELSKVQNLANNFDNHLEVLENLYNMKFLTRHAGKKQILEVSKEPFFNKNGDRVELTDKGRIAANVQGVNQILAAELAHGENALFKKLTPKEIAAVTSCLVVSFRTEDSKMKSVLPGFGEQQTNLTKGVETVVKRIKQINTIQEKMRLKDKDFPIIFDRTLFNKIYLQASGKTNAEIKEKPWNFIEKDSKMKNVPHNFKEQLTKLSMEVERVAKGVEQIKTAQEKMGIKNKEDFPKTFNSNFSNAIYSLASDNTNKDPQVKSILSDFTKPYTKLTESVEKVGGRIGQIKVAQKKSGLKNKEFPITFDRTFSNAIYSLASGNSFDYVYNMGIKDKPRNFMEGDFAGHVLRTKKFIEQLRNSLGRDELELKVKLHTAAGLLDKKPVSDVLHPEDSVKSDRFEFYPKLESSSHRKPYNNNIDSQEIGEMLDYAGVSKDGKLRIAYYSTMKTSPASIGDYAIATNALFSNKFKDSIKQDVKKVGKILNLYKGKGIEPTGIAKQLEESKDTVLSAINNYEIENKNSSISDIYEQKLKDGGLVFEETSAAEFKDKIFDEAGNFLKTKTGNSIDDKYIKDNFRLMKGVNLHAKGIDRILGEADMMVYDKKLGKVLMIGECKAGDLAGSLAEGLDHRENDIKNLMESGVDSAKTIGYDEVSGEKIPLPEEAFTLNPEIRLITTKGFHTKDLQGKYGKKIYFSKFDRVDIQLLAESLLFQLKQEHNDK